MYQPLLFLELEFIRIVRNLLVVIYLDYIFFNMRDTEVGSFSPYLHELVLKLT